MNGSPRRVLEINLVGTINCLEFCRQRVRDLIFLSTSRVYAIEALREVALREGASRLELEPRQSLEGVSEYGISERFPLDGPRSFYGASKLASELLIQEYVASTGVRAVINRCGVIAGPGQFGKVDQGVFTLWVASHHFGRPLRYTGFGGTGKQVRDLLHPDDLCDLLHRQLARMAECSGQTYNVGGGVAISTSLLELTGICREVTGRQVEVECIDETSPVDIPLYLTDGRKVQQAVNWLPSRDVRTIVGDIHRWIVDNERSLQAIL
jgi:CDP-paratose 2-epimerase